jgi:O-antigen biosynthesis protein
MACLESLEVAPGYEIGEVVLVDNGSAEPESQVLRRHIERHPSMRLLDYAGPFNWAAINNMAASTCTSDQLLFLNNDIEAKSEGWLHALVELAQRPEVGAVGARLVYPDGKLQHAGVIFGTESIVGHIFQGLPRGRRGYGGWDEVVRSYSAVTAACMMVRRSVFEELGGFDEAFPVAFNDTDFCIRAGELGYRVLYTPHAELTHHESVSRGLSGYSRDFQVFLSRWWDLLQEDDPFYNPNLSRFDSFCPLRAEWEDDRWRQRMEGMRPASYELEPSGPS